VPFRLAEDWLLQPNQHPGAGSVLPRVLRVRQIASSGSEVALALDAPRAGVYELTLFDVLGRRVQRSSTTLAGPEFGHRVVLQTSTLRTGVFFLRAHHEGLVSSTKLLIIR